MPIYAYRCESCGHQKDVLQKLSDAPLTQCPECGQASYRKQLTAAGFQLKGSGWYATDFRQNAPVAKPADAATASAGGADGAAAAGKSDAPAPSAAPAKSEAVAPATGGCGSSCGCH